MGNSIIDRAALLTMQTAARDAAEATEAAYRARMDASRAEAANLAQDAKQAAARDTEAKVRAASEQIAVKAAAAEGRNIMPPSIAAAKAGVTTGEWGQVLREVFGEYRAPTGIHAKHVIDTARLEDVRRKVEEVSGRLGRTLTFVVGKPGLDGHSNGAEQIAVRARDAGMEVVYEGIRLTPAEIVNAALEEGVHIVGLSILSGSHLELVPGLLAELRELGVDAPVVVGGIIPEDDRVKLGELGVAAVYTPKDFELAKIMSDIADLTTAHRRR